MSPRKKLGELLRDRQHISEEALADALREQSRKNSLLGEVLLQRNLVDRDALVDALEETTRVPFVDCRSARPTPEALALVPRATAVRHTALPLEIRGKRLLTAMAEPQNLTAIDELRFVSGMEVAPRLAFRHELMEAIDCHYALQVSTVEDGIPDLLNEVDISDVQFFTATATDRNQAAMREVQAEMRGDRTPAVRLVTAILRHAYEKKASDIHVEQLADEALVRLRIDGVLHELTRVPGELRNQFVSRIKILSDMDIAERRLPQDGRLLVRVGEGDLDMRVSTLPTQYGEKIVMRLLDSRAANVPFENLGLSAEQAQVLTALIKQPQGMLLVTGPTGSGKSTTLYSALNLIRSPHTNIVTVEDPVEYVLPGVNQVQINPKAGRTFANTLRSMLRQDPNVIMVGEIRDAETAEIALTASQTGHLVFSTLHTNDSVSAATRIIDLGVPPFLVASSVTAIIAQRLVRKLCSCHETVPASIEFVTRWDTVVGTAVPAQMKVPVGCQACEGSGYKGRVGIFELLICDDALRAAIRSGLREDEIRDQARSRGIRMLYEDAVDKVRSGLTTLDEVARVVPFPLSTTNNCTSCEHPLAASFIFCPYCGQRIAKPTVVPAPRPHRSSHSAVVQNNW